MNPAHTIDNRQSETRNTYVYSPPGSNWLYQRGSDTRIKSPNGNTASTSTASFTYDGFNRLATSQAAAETTTYTYNALGQRIRKINQNGLATGFHYGPDGELLFEMDQAGNTKAYVWLDGRPLARIDNNAQIYYYHVDHLGTPQAMTDAAGTVVWKAYYDPFGKATVRVGTVENNLRLPGQYYDRGTGLHQNYFRDFDPTTGRYTEADPIGLDGGLNIYTYVGGNPLSRIDPDGRFFFVPLLGPSVAAIAADLGLIGATGWAISKNASNGNNVIPFPGSKRKEVDQCQPPNDDDPCESTKKTLDKWWDQLQKQWINPANPAYPEQLRTMREFNDAVDWYNAICHAQKGHPKYQKRFSFVDVKPVK